MGSDWSVISMCDIRNSSSKLYAWKIAHLDNNALAFYYVDAKHSVNIWMMLKIASIFLSFDFQLHSHAKAFSHTNTFAVVFQHYFCTKKMFRNENQNPKECFLSFILLVSAILMKSVDTIYSLSLNAHIYAGLLSIGHILWENMLPLHHQIKMRSKLLIGIMNFGNFLQSKLGERMRVGGREWVKVLSGSRERERENYYCSTAQKIHLYSIAFFFYRSFCFSTWFFNCRV